MSTDRQNLHEHLESKADMATQGSDAEADPEIRRWEDLMLKPILRSEDGYREEQKSLESQRKELLQSNQLADQA